MIASLLGSGASESFLETIAFRVPSLALILPALCTRAEIARVVESRSCMILSSSAATVNILVVVLRSKRAAVRVLSRLKTAVLAAIAIPAQIVNATKSESVENPRILEDFRLIMVNNHNRTLFLAATLGDVAVGQGNDCSAVSADSRKINVAHMPIESLMCASIVYPSIGSVALYRQNAAR